MLALYCTTSFILKIYCYFTLLSYLSRVFVAQRVCLIFDSQLTVVCRSVDVHSDYLHDPPTEYGPAIVGGLVNVLSLL